MKNITTTTNAPVATQTETHEVIQVKGGKFHRPKQTTHARMEWLKPMPTECGYTVTPLNVFNDIARALEYTGGHREHLCAKCFPPATLTAHTPGPWSVQPGGYCRSVIHRAGHPDQVVANAYGNEETAAANARLIAAAPDLLNMLQRMIDECGQTRVAPEGILASAPCLLTLEHARAAIAIATGGAK